MTATLDLHDLARALPNAPGVYTFHGEGDAPLYIGKSVRIRARVLDHLRSPDEARLTALTRRFSFERTAGDIGAQLLEAQQVKLQQPLFNKRLRRNRRLCTITLSDGCPEIVNVHDAGDSASYGLYPSRYAAIERLRELADDHLLCYGALGIERLPAGKACFRHALRRCSGVCCGLESEDDHRHRLLAALVERHVEAWPYRGAIGIVERSEDMRQIHVVRNWSYLGSVENKRAALRLVKPTPAFDRDGYKILVRPLLSRSVEVINLSPEHG
ncbi:endonuclease [Stenotrophomonas sp.]|uniref:endonuclease n=1 Tax=Stenotrophomonas sp. TaxID=69392 RepID=UPI0028AF805E|nr:endonuclease [Stenotrophomonas sp.]